MQTFLILSAFANIGWTGWIGSIQGYSSTHLAISEIGVYFSGNLGIKFE